MVYAWSKTSVSKFGIFLEKGNSNLKNQMVLLCIWFSSPKIVWNNSIKHKSFLFEEWYNVCMLTQLKISVWKKNNYLAN